MKQTRAYRSPARPAPVRTVARALAVLRSFSASREQSLTDVARATGLDKATARRLLTTLGDQGFVVHDDARARYALGPVIRKLAVQAVDGTDVKTIASPVLAELSSRLKLTAFISIYKGGEAVCLERLHDVRGVEVRWWAVGDTLPLNCGAAPKLLLAFQQGAEIDKVLGKPLKALTPKTIVDAGALRERLALIRKRGYEFAVDDVALGLGALAMPVFAADGSIACSISLSGLAPQMSVRGRPIHLDDLRAARETIQDALAGRVGVRSGSNLAT